MCVCVCVCLSECVCVSENTPTYTLNSQCFRNRAANNTDF